MYEMDEVSIMIALLITKLNESAKRLMGVKYATLQTNFGPLLQPLLDTIADVAEHQDYPKEVLEFMDEVTDIIVVKSMNGQANQLEGLFSPDDAEVTRALQRLLGADRATSEAAQLYIMAMRENNLSSEVAGKLTFVQDMLTSMDDAKGRKSADEIRQANLLGTKAQEAMDRAHSSDASEDQTMVSGPVADEVSQETGDVAHTGTDPIGSVYGALAEAMTALNASYPEVDKKDGENDAESEPHPGNCEGNPVFDRDAFNVAAESLNASLAPPAPTANP